MDVARLESLIALAVANLVRAQQLAAPGLDLCTPGMVDEAKRFAMKARRHDLAIASVYARTATEELQQASAMLAEYLEPRKEQP